MQILILLLATVSLSSTALSAQPLQAIFEQESRVALINPHDLKLSPDGQYLMVSDVGNNRVAMLDPDSLELVGHFGADHQAGTHDIDFDKNGLAYVADTHNNRVTIYRMQNMQAVLIGELSESIRGPEGVLAHPKVVAAAFYKLFAQIIGRPDKFAGFQRYFKLCNAYQLNRVISRAQSAKR